MRLNKIKRLVVPFVCFSLLFGCSNNSSSNDLTNLENKIEYTNLLETIDEQYKASLQSVVSILNFSSVKLQSIGSGFIYDEEDNYQYIITNQHVIEEAAKLKVVSCTGEVKSASLVGRDKIFDVALLKVEKFKNTKKATFPNSDFRLIENPSIGEEVYALGNPGTIDNRGTVSYGIISGVDRDAFSSSSTFENADYAIQVDLALNPGNSGGPLFNQKQEVIGINTFKIDVVNNQTYKGLNFALPIQDALLIVENIRFNQGFTRASLGENVYQDVSSLTIFQKQVLGLDTSFSKGILLREKGNTNVLNISQYSIITNINGYEVNTEAEFRRRLYQFGVNKNLKIKYYEFKNGYTFEELEISVNPFAA